MRKLKNVTGQMSRSLIDRLMYDSFDILNKCQICEKKAFDETDDQIFIDRPDVTGRISRSVLTG